MKKLLTIILLLFNLSSIGQTLEWAISSGGTNPDYITGSVTDIDGNLYNVGAFNGTVDFDPSPNVFVMNSIGTDDIFVQKLDPTGNLVWVKSMGGPNSDVPVDVEIDDNNNIHITGYFRDTADFDPGPGVLNLISNGGLESFVAKLDPNGDLIWAHSFGSTGSDAGQNLAIDAMGNVIITGGFVGTVDFDPSPAVFNMTSSGSTDAYFHKLDSNGNFVWASRIGAAGLEIGFALDVDPMANIYVTGAFTNTIDLNPHNGVFNVTSPNFRSLFVLKLDPAGAFQWGGSYGGIGITNFVHTLKVADNGDVITCGSVIGLADMDPGPGVDTIANQGDSDMFIQKLDANGNYQWATLIGGPEFDEAFSFDLDSDGNIFLGGFIVDTVDLDPGPGVFNVTGPPGGQAIVEKLDPNGNFLWGFSLNDMVGSSSEAIALDTSGNIYVSGNFAGSAVDFDPGPGVFIQNTIGNVDHFTMKIADCLPSSDSISPSACSSYTTPSGNATYTTSGTYSDTLVNVAGCDSILTIFLTIEQATASSETETACGSYTWQGMTLSTSGTYQDTIMNAAGCDSVMTLNLTINQATSSTETVTACDNYSWQGMTFSSSGSYQDTIMNAAGCDSVMTLNLTINTSTSFFDMVTACNSYNWQGSTLTATGIYMDTVMNAAGCDSVLTLNLIINQASSSSETVTACDNYVWRGTTFNSSGMYQDTIMNAAGCDSVLTLNLTINQATSSSETATACGSYAWQGSTFSTSGTYQDTIMNAAGCDSVLTLNLTVNQPSSFIETVSACGNYSWQGTNYTSSGSYQDTIVNAAGCDSILTLNLTINQATSSTLTVTACDSYTWQGTTFSSSGAYQDIIMNTVGCDSVMNLILTINPTTGSSETVNACDTYDWQGMTFTSSGTYVDTLMNANGCDSVLTLNLTISTVDNTVSLSGDTLISNQANATYQWFDCDSNTPIPGENSQNFTPTTTGNYAVAIDVNGCQDTSACQPVVIIGVENIVDPVVQLFPNPNEGRFTVELGANFSPTPVQLTVFNLQGVLIFEKTTDQRVNQLDLSGISTGTYFLRVVQDGKSSMHKIIVQ